MDIILLIPAAISPVFKKIFSDNILGNKLEGWLLPLILIMFGAAFISGMAAYLHRQCLLYLSESIEKNDAELYVRNMMYAPVQGTDEFSHLSKIYAAKNVAKILTRDFLEVCFAVVSIAIYLPLMFREDVFMTFVALGLAAMSIALSFLRHVITQKAEAGGINPQTAENEAKRVGLYGLMNMPAIKAADSEGRFFSALISARSTYAAAGIKKEEERAYGPLDDIGEIIFMNLLLFLSAIRITQRSFTIGSYLAFQTYASMLFEPMATLASAKSVFDSFKKKLAQLNTVEKRTALPDTEISAGELDGYALLVDNVRFSREGKTNTSEGVSFYAPEGSRIAVVGGTLSDKTAFLRLLAGFDTPSAGTITVGGVSAASIHRHGMKILGYAARAPVFFSGLLRDNITFWDKNVDDTHILDALDFAGLPARTFPGGLAHHILDGGQNLSAGERRRIEFTRAFLHSPKIMIVDDIFFRLIADDQAAIQKELATRRVTLIASSESFSAVKNFDFIVSLNIRGESGGVR
jgi:ABC-type bacteriocin/lantibiotic exporter with double-glycine peptidase domain